MAEIDLQIAKAGGGERIDRERGNLPIAAGGGGVEKFRADLESLAPSPRQIGTREQRRTGVAQATQVFVVGAVAQIMIGDLRRLVGAHAQSRAAFGVGDFESAQVQIAPAQGDERIDGPDERRRD